MLFEDSNFMEANIHTYQRAIRERKLQSLQPLEAEKRSQYCVRLVLYIIHQYK